MTFEVVRADDPRCAVLEADGYTVVGESWAARLRDPDPVRLKQAVRRAEGVVVRELGVECAPAVYEVETANEPDYPYTPATHRVVGSLETIRELWTNVRVFGTGGAAVNDASLGANLALGYVVDERWRSYAPPAR